MKAIIIDDEPLSYLALKKILAKNHPEVEILAYGQSVEEGVRLIQQYHPEVVFLDIEMPDGLGFDLLQRVDNQTLQVIFITAHNKYAITAIKFGALDYLLKPIAEDELARSLQRINEKPREKIAEEQIQILLETLSNLETKKLPTLIAISTSEGILYKQVKDIIRLKADQNFTEFFILNHTKKILASINLGEYEKQFEPYREFMRVHRGHIVNLQFVDKFVKADGGYLVMTDGEQVSVSRPNRDDLLKRLGEI